VRKFTLSIAAMVFATGACCLLGVAWGQTGAPARTAAAPQAHKVGLIDMAYLFSKYEKFNVLQEDLRAEMEQAQQKLKATADRIRAIQGELKQFTQGSPEFVERERQITQLSAQIQADQKTAQLEFYRKESQLYQQIYLEVTDLVEKYAEAKQYTLILRFNRDGETSTNDDPQKVMQTLQRQVVYYRADDDITDAILNYLNQQYSRNAAGGARSSTGAGAPRTGARPSSTSNN